MYRHALAVALLLGSALAAACSNSPVVTHHPLIALSSGSVVLSAAMGGPPPAAQQVSVSNGGDGSLGSLSAAVSYGAGQPTGWLSASLSASAAPAMLSLQAAMGIPPGSYGAVVDVSSPDAGNSPQQVTVRFTVAAADLMISAPPTLVATPASVLPGGRVGLSAWSVKNQGDAGSNDFSNGFYLSSDAVITASDVRLDGNSNTALASGASFDWGAPTLTIPAGTAPGTYYLGILVDDHNATPEADEGNNSKSVAITVVAPQPDLVISAPATLVATPASVLPGGHVGLSAWTVTNQGSGGSGDFSNGFYLSSDAVITATDVRLDGNGNTSLAPGASFNWGAPTLTIPAGTAPGNYFIGILVDDGNASAESDESNNSKSVAITVLAPVADLVISAPQTLVATPASVLPGGHVSLSAWTVSNQGSGSSNNFSNGFYLSSDALITASDVRLDGNANTALAPGASFNWGAPTLTIPAGTAPGNYFIGILVDEANGTPESDESNNSKSVAITVVAPLADLVISAPAVLVASPSSVLPGGQVSLSAWTVTNQGNASSNAFSNGFYLSSDAVITASDVRLDGNSNTPLAPGAAFAWGGPTLTIPAGTAPGSYFIGILVDEANGTPESNEGNNYKSVAITVIAPLADLVISAPATLVATPASVLPGGHVTLSAWTVKNQGNVASNAFLNGFYLSSDAVITASDVRLDGNGNSALAPGASFNWGGPTLTIPAGTAPGTYFIGILVDEANGTAESNEGNNYKSVAITVIAPLADLVISAPLLLAVSPTIVSAGGRVTLSAWTVTNQGSVSSNAFVNGFYLSADAVITSADLRLDGNSNNALAAGASFSWGGPTLTIPSTLAAGTYYIGILVDQNNGTPESNELNNYKSVPLTVVAPLLRYAFDGTATNSGSLAGYNGSVTSVTYPAGKFGQAIKFDGTAGTAAVFAGTGALIGGSSKWTISYWFREDVLKATSWLWDFRSGGAPGTAKGWETYHGVNPGLITTCSDGGCFSFSTPATGVWHSLLYRYDGPSASLGAPVQIYVDGAFAGQIANPSSLPLISPGVTDIRLGNANIGSNGGLFYVDELRVYNGVYSIDQQCTLIIGGTWNGSSCALP